MYIFFLMTLAPFTSKAAKRNPFAAAAACRQMIGLKYMYFFRNSRNDCEKVEPFASPWFFGKSYYHRWSWSCLNITKEIGVIFLFRYWVMRVWRRFRRCRCISYVVETGKQMAREINAIQLSSFWLIQVS